MAAHGNSIRAIVKELFNYSEELILKTEIGWCEPWIFKFNKNGTIEDMFLYETRSANKEKILF